MTALALSFAGLMVTVLERSGDKGRTGAAIHVEEKLLVQAPFATPIDA